MIRLQFKSEEEVWYPDDIARIKKILNDRGYDASDMDIQLAWEEYSDKLCASWLILPEKDADVFYSVFYCLEEAPNQ